MKLGVCAAGLVVAAMSWAAGSQFAQASIIAHAPTAMLGSASDCGGAVQAIARSRPRGEQVDRNVSEPRDDAGLGLGGGATLTNTGGSVSAVATADVVYPADVRIVPFVREWQMAVPEPPVCGLLRPPRPLLGPPATEAETVGSTAA